MLAVMLAEFGPPSVLTPAEPPDPVPGPGQVVVEAAFANITFVETQIRAGLPPNPAMAPALPAVLGNGIGGVVSAVGVEPTRRWPAPGSSRAPAAAAATRSGAPSRPPG